VREGEEGGGSKGDRGRGGSEGVRPGPLHRRPQPLGLAPGSVASVLHPTRANRQWLTACRHRHTAPAYATAH